MKNIFYYLITAILVIFLNTQIYSQDPVNSIIDVNNITSWISNNGFHPWSVNNDFNGTFPKGTAGAIYTEGIVWGGKVYDGGSTLIRVNGNTYSSGTSPITRLYRVRTDYYAADLKDDASNFFIVPLDSVTDKMTSQIYTQYKKDWTEWPADKGAPYYDFNNDGIYEPETDIPGVPGASQTVWISYDDSNIYTPYGSPQIGMEVQETYWAYANDSTLLNTIYKRVKLIYKGLTTSTVNSHIDSMYITLFSDTDDGFYTDDYLGCDTSLNLGYVYNSSTYDAIYNKLNLVPPAVGYTFIHGAAEKTGNANDSAIVNMKWRHGYKYFNSKPLSVFIPFTTGSYYFDPIFNYEGALQFYNLMRGYQPSPKYPGSKPFYTNIPGQRRGGYGTYLLDGDPVTGTGWIDGQIDPAGARRLDMISGPFNMNLKDTVEMTLALVGGIGTNNISSITTLRYFTKYSIFKYNYFVNQYTSGELKVEKPDTTSSKILPDHFELFQNYPNPFNPATTIKYYVFESSHVVIKIYDMLGRLVDILVDEDKTKGEYKIKWVPTTSSGVYFYRMTAGSYTQVKKMVYIK